MTNMAAVQRPHNQMMEFLEKDNVVRELFGNWTRNTARKFGEFHYKSSESVLSDLYSSKLLKALHYRVSDKTATKIIKEVACTRRIPVKFTIIECIMWIMTFLPIAFMFVDVLLEWTSLGAVFYLYASACAVSLLVTVRLAKKEWKVHNWNEKKKEKE